MKRLVSDPDLHLQFGFEQVLLGIGREFIQPFTVSQTFALP
jgi:hypothetical protein